jgi:hypothetical protein
MSIELGTYTMLKNTPIRPIRSVAGTGIIPRKGRGIMLHTEEIMCRKQRALEVGVRCILT